MVAEQIPSVPAPTMEIEVIGPDKAHEYLGLAARNRPMRPGAISQYARDMRTGRWFSSVIRFGEDGLMYDGQHRMHAVIEADCEVLFWVERGIPLDAMVTLDMGLRRTPGDVLAIKGETNANVLGAACRLAQFLTMFPGIAPSGMSKAPPSIEEILDYLEANPEIRHSVAFGESVARSLRFSPSVASALHYLQLSRSRNLALDFWEQMLTGAEMKADTGPYALRMKVLDDRLKPIGTRMDSNMLTAVSIKAWCYWEQARPLKQLRWLRGGMTPEPFPFIGKKYE